MKASALEAQPKAKSSNGTPPTAPCSITQVTAPCRPSSRRIRGTLAEMPKPRLTALPVSNSSATRRAMTFWMLNSGTRNVSSGRKISPEMAGSYSVCVDPPVIHQPAGHAHVVRLQGAVLGDTLDLRDDDAAIVAGGERLVEPAESGALVFIGEVAALVGRGGADDRHLRRDRLEVEP